MRNHLLVFEAKINLSICVPVQPPLISYTVGFVIFPAKPGRKSRGESREKQLENIDVRVDLRNKDYMVNYGEPTLLESNGIVYANRTTINFPRK